MTNETIIHGVEIVGAICSILAIALFFLKQTWVRGGAAIVLILATGFGVYWTYHQASVLDDEIYLQSGTYPLEQFLRFLSQGPTKVTIDSAVGDDLRRKNVRIQTRDLSGMPLKNVLDEILLPQLPGPRQWNYEIYGKTVMIKRR